MNMVNLKKNGATQMPINMTKQKLIKTFACLLAINLSACGGEQSAQQMQMQLFITKSRSCVNKSQRFPRISYITRFFFQFTFCCKIGIFSFFQLPCGKLQRRLTYRISKLFYHK